VRPVLPNKTVATSRQSLWLKERPIAVLARLPGIMPSTLMDVVKPMLTLQRQGRIRFWCSLEIYPWTAAEPFDLVIFCRNLEPRYQLLDRLLSLGKPYIYDLDDNFFEIPPELAEASYYREPARLEQLRRYIQSANLVRVYSPALREQLQDLTSRAELVSAPLDWSAIVHPAHRASSDLVKIVYATSRQEDDLYRIFAPALHRLLKELPGRLQITFWGSSPPEFRSYPNVIFRPYTANYDRYLRRFSRLGFDIGLAPLPDSPFYRSKTENKFREYAACQIAGIYSDTEVYRRVVQPGISGLLVENTPEAWYQALHSLASDPGLRQRVAQQARQQAERLFPPGDFESVWWEQIQAVAAQAFNTAGENAAHPASARPRRGGQTPSAPASPEDAYRRFKRQVQTILATRQPGKIAFHTRFHLQNLWWLVKINGFKRI